MTDIQYDDVGRKKRIDHADGRVTAFHYRSCNNCFPANANAVWCTQSKTTGQAAERQHFDAQNRPVGTRTRGLDGAFVYTAQAYTPRGNKAWTSQPHFSGGAENRQTFEYDHLNRRITTSYPDGSTASTDFNGHVLTATNRKGQTRVQLMNGAGWVMRSTDDNGTPVDFTYGPFGELTGTRVNNDPSTQVVIGYDTLGRKILLDDPNTGTIDYRYNALGLLAEQTDVKGQVTRYTYDQLGRQLTRTDNATAGGPAHSWQYDTSDHGVGKLDILTGTNTDGTVYREDYDYTPAGQPQTVKTQLGNRTFTVTQHYDAHKRPLGVTYHRLSSGQHLQRLRPPEPGGGQRQPAPVGG